MNQVKQFLVAGLLAACSQAWAAPTLTLVTTPNPAVFGSVVDVDVRISDIVELYAYNFSLNFDASLFRAIDVTEGAFLGAGGDTFSDGGTIGDGTISYIFNTLVGPEPGVSGSGSLAHIRLEAIGVGSSAFSFSDVLFLDSSALDIAVALDAGADAAVVPEPASYALFGIGLFGAVALRRRSLTQRC
jgi:hypothetical protein